MEVEGFGVSALAFKGVRGRLRVCGLHMQHAGASSALSALLQCNLSIIMYDVPQAPILTTLEKSHMESPRVPYKDNGSFQRWHVGFHVCCLERLNPKPIKR